MNRTLYPETLSEEESEKYETKEFYSSGTYEDDYNKACKYAKKNGGEVYTLHHEGESVYYWLGKHWVNRVGFCVFKFIDSQKLKGGQMEK